MKMGFYCGFFFLPPNEANHGLNLRDTKRVKEVPYDRPWLLQYDKIMLTDDDCVRSMFSIYHQHRMFPRIDMDDMLLRSPEDILKSLILAQDYF